MTREYTVIGPDGEPAGGPFEDEGEAIRFLLSETGYDVEVDHELPAEFEVLYFIEEDDSVVQNDTVEVTEDDFEAADVADPRMVAIGKVIGALPDFQTYLETVTIRDLEE